MSTSLWVWPTDPKAQRRMLRKVAKSEHLMSAMQAMVKTADGLSNAQVDDTLSDFSQWQTRWVTEQLMALGFADYKVDFFGGPGKYVLTDLGRTALSAITEKPAQVQPPTSTTPPPKPLAPQPAAPQAR